MHCYCRRISDDDEVLARAYTCEAEFTTEVGLRFLTDIAGCIHFPLY